MGVKWVAPYLESMKARKISDTSYSLVTIKPHQTKYGNLLIFTNAIPSTAVRGSIHPSLAALVHVELELIYGKVMVFEISIC